MIYHDLMPFVCYKNVVRFCVVKLYTKKEKRKKKRKCAYYNAATSESDCPIGGIWYQIL